ncbi:MAG: cytidylate kinase-like family protein [Ignavibacterium album]|uniref:cytidylate kinase-like family protein n=1 Tax=Ignavibacterium album TaxID=591197 RepID=UPI0026EB7DDF|nr:cytidylate kinase-like family protein [Ignavibacterium album]MCX8106686.1 cytidylate kinase-like family protein [Ignavibacterium album]
MLTLGAYEKCKRYIESHSKESKEPSRKRELFPCITISRQTGAGSYEVSEKLIKILDEESKESEQTWTYFNKELIQKVIEDHNLPSIVSNYLAESKYQHINDAVYELLGVKPSDWTLLHKTTETILQIARMGKAIIVGRGGNVITSKLPNAFHIRLVAPLETRIRHVQEVFGFSKQQAMEYIEKEDKSRKKYLKTHFFRDPEDPTLYHLILNTGALTYKEAAEIIATSLKIKFPGSFRN